MKIKATIKVINPVRTGVSQSSGNEWRAQDIVIGWTRTTESGYQREQLLQVTLHGESIDHLAALNPVAGQTEIEGTLDFQTRTFNGRVYNDISLTPTLSKGEGDKAQDLLMSSAVS